jgi:hypothetical protein
MHWYGKTINQIVKTFIITVWQGCFKNAQDASKTNDGK